MSIVVVGDIGGTNARFKLLQISDDNVNILKQETLASKKATSFREILHMFLDGMVTPILGLFAIAGVVREGSAFFVNMGWKLRTLDFVWEIEEEFGIGKIIFFNDFEAASYGCLEFSECDYFQLNPEIKPVTQERKAVIGPGTGLGEALLVWEENGYKAWPGEGGHSDFAPHNEEQWRLAQFLMNLVQTLDEYEHFRPCEGVSNEACIAGVGAFHIYEFYRNEFPEKIDEEFERLWESNPKDRLKNMMHFGFSNKNELCRKCIETWIQLLAYECGNFIARNLPFAGLYLIGGMIAKNFKGIVENKELFSKALLTKPTHICKIIENVPIYICNNEDSGMIGVISCAKKYLRSHPQ